MWKLRWDRGDEKSPHYHLEQEVTVYFLRSEITVTRFPSLMKCLKAKVGQRWGKNHTLSFKQEVTVNFLRWDINEIGER